MKPASLYKGIITIFIANAINLLFSLFNGFVLPKYLSVDSYACIKTYQLYLSYVGVLHLGYIDGVYLLYGGRKLPSLDPKEIGHQRSILLILQALMTAALLIISIVIGDGVLGYIAFSVVPFNVTQYYKLLYQATGEFKEYSRIMNMSSLFIFFGNLCLLIFRVDDGLKYAFVYTVVYFIIWLISEIVFYKTHLQTKFEKPDLAEAKKTIGSGFPLMLGNFSSILLTSTDRWFVKFLMPTLAFAQYSFAVSIENLLSVVVTPISTTLYNFFCTQTDEDQCKKMHDIILVFSTFIIIAAFPVKFVAEHYLGNYTDSLTILFILFAANIFLTINKCFYINLYKAKKLQGRYFKHLISVIIAGIILNAVFYMILKTKESFAAATLISSVLWFALCRFDFRQIEMSYRQYIYIFSSALAFIFLGVFLNPIKGFLFYFIFWVIITFFLEKRSFFNMYKMLLNFVMQKLYGSAED